ncbi:MAG: FkbM family methyltransferase [Williamsia sp.]|nr:FkbM family methyltransferase [Williamsia sp.]
MGKLKGYVLVKNNDIEFKITPSFRYFWFWMQFNEGNYEKETFIIFNKFLKKHYNYVDIGAWIGPTVLYCAPLVNKVIAFEPDPIAFRQLNKHVSINKTPNVILNNYALSSRNGSLKMSSFGGNLGDSMSSLLDTHHAKNVSIQSRTWMEFSENIDFKIDFIKIDIEGGEFELLPTMVEYLEKYKPNIHLSLHAPYLDATVRLGEMKKIINSIKPYYSQILSEELKAITYDDLLTKPYTDNFTAVLLLN